MVQHIVQEYRREIASLNFLGGGEVAFAAPRYVQSCKCGVLQS